jgi:hypothetical protein
MGHIVRAIDAETTRYHWYPGERVEWLRAIRAVLTGLLTFAAVGLLTRSMLYGLATGASVTAVLTGFAFGRRDLRGIRAFPQRGRARRAVVVGHSARAAWRGAVQGMGGAAGALCVANLGAHGLLADWLLPVLPVLLGALAHQAGMVYERRAAASARVGTAPRTRAWVGSYGDSATTLAGSQSPKTPTSTRTPVSTVEGR